MKKLLPVLIIRFCTHVFSEEAEDVARTSSKNNLETYDEYYEFGSGAGITIYGDTKIQEIENMIIHTLNGSEHERERFIQEDLLVKAGFRRTANSRYRKTTGGEKALSIVHGVTHAVFSRIPMKPFFEEEYGKLPEGELYSFYSVWYMSQFKDVSIEIRTIMELEYMFQIEFCNGVLTQNWNITYYTDKNIKRFEELAQSLPDLPSNIKRLKDRYLYIELPKIKNALERYKNPSEKALQARKNVRKQN
ncbi:MAG: hypothetical protein LBU25_04510 [Treponema sp.]|jgi:hypothetical protein|nr:hypothetical protein [Treponema sp.]